MSFLASWSVCCIHYGWHDLGGNFRDVEKHSMKDEPQSCLQASGTRSIGVASVLALPHKAHCWQTKRVTEVSRLWEIGRRLNAISKATVAVHGILSE